jgi:formate/nitrite transporter FocA (FNT family)/nucleotide-binding universal stress UspA family protein
MADREGRATASEPGETDGSREREQSQRPAEPRSVAPSEGSVVRDRFSSDEVFQRIVAAADEELTSSRRELFFSGIAAGFAITITFLLYATLSASTGKDPILSVLLYPIGFIYIIIGGYQLYTENTLPPVALTLERFASLTALVRHWLIVLAGNFTGGALGALALAHTGVFEPGTADVATSIAMSGIGENTWDLFFKGAFAGLIVAGVVWVEYAARDTISRLVVIYLAFLCIPLGDLYHVVVSFTEVVYLLANGQIGAAVGMTEFVIPVLLGNTIGGILLVTVVNYYQTSEHRLGRIAEGAPIQRLTRREWFFGHLVGRAYVPVIEHHEYSGPTDPEADRILVPVSNPRTERSLVTLACTLASQRESATVHLVHMVQVPPGMNLQYNNRQRNRIQAESESKLATLVDEGAAFDVPIETSTVVSYRSFEEVFSQARTDDADLVVMGWGTDRHWETLRAGRPLEELTSSLPCDFLVLKDRGLDTARILLPTNGGPDSDLGAETASVLREATGAEVTLLHVVEDGDGRERGEQFLKEWAADHDLADAELIVDDSGDVEGAIEREAADQTLLQIGATERGLLSRLATDSLHFQVVNDVDCSVLLAERPADRSLRERLFGS